MKFSAFSANTMLTWSMQLHRLADQLIKDEPLPDRSSENYKKSRRLIQNNMDASRYLSFGVFSKTFLNVSDDK